MSGDIVARLRHEQGMMPDWRNVTEGSWGLDDRLAHEWPALLNEAAAEIERLRAEVAELRAAEVPDGAGLGERGA